MEIHSWDEISDEIGITNVPTYGTNEPMLILGAWYTILDADPTGDSWHWVVLPGLTIVTIKDERGHMSMVWWGEHAARISDAIRKTLET